jgi:hypothetical protein
VNGGGQSLGQKETGSAQRDGPRHVCRAMHKACAAIIYSAGLYMGKYCPFGFEHNIKKAENIH